MRRLILSAAAIWLAGQVATAQRAGVRYMSDSRFQVRQMGGYDPNRRDGKCTIRVRIDNNVDVALRGNEVILHVIAGGPGRDEGSECNSPLPRGGVSNFQFRGIDGRGQVRLVQEPRDSNRWTAIVNIVDSKGGDEGYTFDLTWNYDGSGPSGGGGGLFPGGNNRPTRPTRPGDGGFFPGGGGGGGNIPDMNVAMAGDGELNDGTNRYRLRDLRVQVRNNECRLKMSTDRNQEVEFWGPVNRNSGECMLRSANSGSVNARARLNMSGRNVRGMSMDGVYNGRNFNANFNSR